MLSEQNVRAKLAALKPKKRPASASTAFASVAAVLRYLSERAAMANAP